MNSISSHVRLLESREISLFLPIMKELDEFPERFLLTMLRWCGYGRPRHQPLKVWYVYVGLLKDEPVGVTGIYCDDETPPGVCWVGWSVSYTHLTLPTNREV